MGKQKKMIGVRLHESDIDALKELAASENRTMSNLIETVLKDYLIQRGYRTEYISPE